MAIDSRYKLKTGEEVAYFPPVQNTDNPYLTEDAMHADQANQLKGYLYVVTDVGHFEYKGGASGTDEDYKPLGGAILDILTSTRKNASLSADRGRVLKELFDKLEAVLDIDESIDAVRNITMRNNGEVSSGLYMYDNPNTETLYQFVRYDAASNFVEFGSNDGDGEVISAKVDRGKTDWEFQNRIQILKPGRGVSFLTPSAASLDGNSYDDKYELIVNEGGVLELYTQYRGGLGTLVWSSASGGTGSINNITEIANRSYNDLQDLPTDTGSIYEKILIDGLGSGDTVTINRNENKPVHYILLGNAPTAPVDIVIDPNNAADNIIISTLISSSEATLSGVAFLATDGYLPKMSRGATVYINRTVDVLSNTYSLTGDLIKEFEVFSSPDGTLHKIGVANDGTRTSTPL